MSDSSRYGSAQKIWKTIRVGHIPEIPKHIKNLSATCGLYADSDNALDNSERLDIGDLDASEFHGGRLERQMLKRSLIRTALVLSTLKPVLWQTNCINKTKLQPDVRVAENFFENETQVILEKNDKGEWGSKQLFPDQGFSVNRRLLQGSDLRPAGAPKPGFRANTRVERSSWDGNAEAYAKIDPRGPGRMLIGR